MRYVYLCEGKIKYWLTFFNHYQKFFKIKNFADKNEETLTSAKRAVKQSIEGTEANIKWMEKNYEIIAEWLENQIQQNKGTKIPTKK